MLAAGRSPTVLCGRRPGWCKASAIGPREQSHEALRPGQALYRMVTRPVEGPGQVVTERHVRTTGLTRFVRPDVAPLTPA